MKFVRFFAFLLLLTPSVGWAVNNDFQMAAQLLAAAKNANVQQVQYLVAQGADINYVDATGVSIVCTALMNNDVRAAQILQMYGADASKCDSQIKRYNVKNSPKNAGGGGFFGGLSSVQSLTLASLGVGAVIGGLLLMTDVFDPGNDNDSISGGGVRPSPNPDGGSGTGSATAKFTLPYGPAMPNAETETELYTENLNAFSPSDETDILYKNFQLMTNGAGTDAVGQNYLLMMHGYSPLARGYMGMRTLRNNANAPLDLSDINLGVYEVEGGRPVNVAIITQNGINAANKPAGDFSAQKNSLDDKLVAWTTLNTGSTTGVSGASNSMVSSKYYNNKIVLGDDTVSALDDATQEDADLLDNFDLAGWGTVVNNAYASGTDNMLAKVVGGSDSGYTNADYFGFMPNGQMTIYRTGNGLGMVDATTESTGEYTETDNVLSEIELFGKTLAVTMNGNAFVASDGTDSYNGYIGTNGLLYIASVAGGDINQAYEMDGGQLNLYQELGDVDFFNYRAMLNAAQRKTDSSVGGRSKVDVIANTFVLDALRQKTVEDIEDVLFVTGADERKSEFNALINKYYKNPNVTSTYSPGEDAQRLFGNLGGEYNALVLMSTGATETDANYSGAPQFATFENVVPLIYPNAEHYFMSIVPVGLDGGTNDTESVSGFSPDGKLALSEWYDVSADKYYKARMCGVAGTGLSGVDPWCFAAAGVSDELAVASAAGAVGAVKSAFYYLNNDFTNDQVFALLALTADGPWLGTSTDGAILTKETLIAYLDSMYTLPQNFQTKVDDGADYLDVFAEVFGYGLINLERATKPDTKIYYYDGNRIVSANGNAYWRAASNTVFRPSAVLNISGKSISAPFYDKLESIDGNMSLPRVWENQFAFGATDKRGLYMGDVLGDLKTSNTGAQKTVIGDMTFTMNMSQRAYDDYMGGLDNLSLMYANDSWNFGASFQRYLTDGQSRFVGNVNPILALTSNAVVSDVEYKSGNWAFGARAFSGAITDDGLLENDPTIASQYMPMKLGVMHGGQSDVMWRNDKLKLIASVGVANESDTLLGAYTDGLLNLGAGRTNYIDVYSEYNLTDTISVNARATFANTVSDAGGDFILGLSDIQSNAFTVAAKIGGFEFAVAQPLAITDGVLQYAYADYDVIEIADKKYDLDIVDTHIENLNLVPDTRELRLSGTYRRNLGEFTDAAFGFIYRVNPNHTSEFGNETILMTKFTHRLGI